ncbi:hypothetical protein GDO81_001204 [Engystomops pustulosus]|uniref:Pyroglutamyl-peptidase 1 n=2 Tax=Engystomops pustulosus TaxID=76066 RepID=A0AAV7DEE0_ENGPU|nr:hypothetical protein GDO81_001204 [Engystomops pustulosus]
MPLNQSCRAVAGKAGSRSCHVTPACWQLSAEQSSRRRHWQQVAGWRCMALSGGSTQQLTAMEKQRRCVVVTGFGPFGEHAVNASWVAVQELKKLGLGDTIDLHVYEVPVEYQTVQRLIPDLWIKHRPQLIVHVGVSGMATAITLEQCGHNKGYLGLDNCQFCPDTQCCVEGGPECLQSTIDMDAVCKRASAAGLDEVQFIVSTDAGRYLCDFTYYTSLYESHGKSVFIHVPPLGKPYTPAQLGRALQTILQVILDMEHSDNQNNCDHKQ